jgi:tight adherence protein C
MIDDIAKFMFDPANIIMALGAVGMFLGSIAVALPFMKTDQLSPRLKAVAERREELKASMQAKKTSSSRAPRKETINKLNLLLGRLNLKNQIEDRDLRMRLAAGGWRGQGPAVMFVTARLVMPVVMAVVAAILFFGLNLMKLSFAMQCLAVMAGGGFGYYLPNVIVKNGATKRQEIITLAFPDSLDLLLICIEAGLSLEAAFTRLVRELGDACPELAEEFGLLTAELGFLGDRRQALMNFADRVGTSEAKGLVTSLIQSEQYGTPLTVALRVLSDENRASRMSRAEQKAGSLPAMLTGPMIVFFLPVVFIVLLGPAIIQIMNA